VVTINAYPNFPLGNRIGAGFTCDNETPIPINNWCPPGGPGPACRTDRHGSKASPLLSLLEPPWLHRQQLTN